MTVNGIARNKNPNWAGWPRVDAIIAKTGRIKAAINAAIAADATLVSMIRAFYKKNYWDINALDHMRSQAIANEVYDTGVNMGPGVAAEFLQTALNLCNKNDISYPDVAVDGRIGPAGETMRTVNGPASELVVFKTLNVLQGAKYIRLMQADETQERFWHGWITRVSV
jgi:lysozyme family protein